MGPAFDEGGDQAFPTLLFQVLQAAVEPVGGAVVGREGLGVQPGRVGDHLQIVTDRHLAHRAAGLV